MATLAESFLADLEDLSDVEDEEPQQAAAGDGEDAEVRLQAGWLHAACLLVLLSSCC